jgi:N-acetylmuramoyl-L-alanine amidase
MATDSIDNRLSSALAQTGVKVANTSSNDYQELMKRWSDAAERKAVCIPFNFRFGMLDIWGKLP